MTFKNEERVPFSRLTQEERAEIVEGIVLGKNVEVLDNPLTNEWVVADRVIKPNDVYRLLPKKLNIPWGFIDSKFRCAYINERGSVMLSTVPPTLSDTKWVVPEGAVVQKADFLNIDKSGVDWRESLTDNIIPA